MRYGASLSLYVRTKNVDEVRSQLEKDHVCIISGIPGVGKSTLAEITIVDYLTNGWDLVSIRQNIREGLEAMRRDHTAKQILYYDDFLGQISTGEKLGKNEDKALLQFDVFGSGTSCKTLHTNNPRIHPCPSESRT